VIDGYDVLSQAVSLSINCLLRYAGVGAVSVFFFPEEAPHPHRATSYRGGGTEVLDVCCDQARGDD
jgi:hypothetical protein